MCVLISCCGDWPTLRRAESAELYMRRVVHPLVQEHLRLVREYLDLRGTPGATVSCVLACAPLVVHSKPVSRFAPLLTSRCVGALAHLLATWRRDEAPSS
jgi:hypothetical protein